MNPYSQNATASIRYNKMFPALDFLKSIKAGFLDGFSGAFNALTVDDP
jgi:hypothetical protein